MKQQLLEHDVGPFHIEYATEVVVIVRIREPGELAHAVGFEGNRVTLLARGLNRYSAGELGTALEQHGITRLELKPLEFLQ